jgi:hypothetical protein
MIAGLYVIAKVLAFGDAALGQFLLTGGPLEAPRGRRRDALLLRVVAAQAPPRAVRLTTLGPSPYYEIS